MCSPYWFPCDLQICRAHLYWQVQHQSICSLLISSPRFDICQPFPINCFFYIKKNLGPFKGTGYISVNSNGIHWVEMWFSLFLCQFLLWFGYFLKCMFFERVGRRERLFFFSAVPLSLISVQPDVLSLLIFPIIFSACSHLLGNLISDYFAPLEYSNGCLTSFNFTCTSQISVCCNENINFSKQKKYIVVEENINFFILTTK